MKLFLSSSGKIVSHIIKKYLQVGSKVAYITTASKWVDDVSYIYYRKEQFNKDWIKYEEIDIEWKDKDMLRILLKGKDCIFVEWWNTFYLMKAIKETGFDILLKELLNNWLTYIWSSAWAYICCPNIEMAAWKRTENDKCWLEDLSAMNLVPFQLFVHYIPAYDIFLKKEISKSKYEVKILKDWEYLYINGENIDRLFW